MTRRHHALASTAPRRLLLAFGCLLFLLLLSCESKEAELLPRVEIGVFYGGQVQQLKRIEVSELEPPVIGFAVHLPDGFDEKQQRELKFEFVTNGPAGRRVTRLDHLQLPRGQARVDQVIEIPETSRLGIWNLRVTYDQHVLADRALFLVPAS